MSRLVSLVGRLPAPVRRLLKRLPGSARIRDRLYGTPEGPAYPPGAPRPVVYLPTWVQWDVMKQRPQYLLEALSRAGHDVYFVDPRHTGADLKLGNVTITSGLEATPVADVLVYTHFAPTRTMLDRYRDPVVIYDILDDLTIYEPAEVGFPPERTVRFHHGPLMEAASMVIASNPVLVERHQPERADVLLVENGVDPQLFTPEGAAVDLGPGPIVGYHGAIRSWVDFDLLKGVISARPQYRFVLVGPILEGVEEATADLLTLPNTLHVPEQPPEGVAAHVRSFSVGIVPFVVNVTTQGVTPMKLNEYLASGVPVVATPLPSLVNHPNVRVGSDVQTWVSLLDGAVGTTDADREQLRQVALSASWDARIGPLLARLEECGLRYVPFSERKVG